MGPVRRNAFAKKAAAKKIAQKALALKQGPKFLIAGAEVVESLFGSIKQWMYHGGFLTRGLANTRAEFKLIARSPTKMHRPLNIFGVEAIRAAATARVLDRDRTANAFLDHGRIADVADRRLGRLSWADTARSRCDCRTAGLRPFPPLAPGSRAVSGAWTATVPILTGL